MRSGSSRVCRGAFVVGPSETDALLMLANQPTTAHVVSVSAVSKAHGLPLLGKTQHIRKGVGV